MRGIEAVVVGLVLLDPGTHHVVVQDLLRTVQLDGIWMHPVPECFTFLEVEVIGWIGTVRDGKLRNTRLLPFGAWFGWFS